MFSIIHLPLAVVHLFHSNQNLGAVSVVSFKIMWSRSLKLVGLSLPVANRSMTVRCLPTNNHFLYPGKGPAQTSVVSSLCEHNESIKDCLLP